VPVRVLVPYAKLPSIYRDILETPQLREIAQYLQRYSRKYIYAEFVPVRVLVPYAKLPSIYRDILENHFL